MSETVGRVYLVGAGPGASDLITIRGAEALRHAEVVVYDYLVSPEIVRLAPRTAQCIYVGKKGGGIHNFEQSQINEMLIAQARLGRRVVRLKGGDPFIFGRGGEEAEALAAAGIEFEVVPGVTSAIAAPAFAGIPLTHREYGSFVAFLTGHEDFSKSPSASVPWAKLADAAREGGTIVILMATGRLRDNLARLAAGGLSTATPAAAIQWATTAAQKTVTGTVGTLAEEVDRAGLAAPAVVVVGESARLRNDLRWFEKMPLYGRRIVITRAMGKAEDFARRLRALGADAIEFPVIQNAPPDSYDALDGAISRASDFDWIIFTSATGVDAFVERMRALDRDVREFSRASIAAIGPATAQRIGGFGLRVAATPTEFRAEALIGAIGEKKIAGARILIPRAQTAREALPELLRGSGAREVVVAPAYKTVKPAGADGSHILELVATGAIDLVTFTSSSTVSNFRELLGELPSGLKAAAIGPITAHTARQEGFDVVACPAEYTVDGLIESIVKYFHGATLH